MDSFKEKPNEETAGSYIRQHNYFWNSGIFVWSVHTIVNAFRVYQPGIADIFESLVPCFCTDNEQEMINKYFPECEDISVDYAIMEKAEEIFVFPADFGWNDLGTWGALFNYIPHDTHNNAVTSQQVDLYDSMNCIIHTTEERRVSVHGRDG